MSYAVAFKGITRFFNSEQLAIDFCKLAMISQNNIVKADLK